MPKKQPDFTPINEAGLGQLLDAAREKWNAKFQQLNTATTLLHFVAECIESGNVTGLKNLLPKIREAAQSEP